MWVYNLADPISELVHLPGDRLGCTTTCESVALLCLQSGDTLLSQPRPEEWVYAAGVFDGGSGEPLVLWGVMGEDMDDRYGEVLLAPMGGRPEEGFKGHEDVVRFALPASEGRLV